MYVEEVIDLIVYKDILERMKAKGWSTYRIRKKSLLSQWTIRALRQGTPVSMETIDTICRELGCQPGDILEYVEDEQDV